MDDLTIHKIIKITMIILLVGTFSGIVLDTFLQQTKESVTQKSSGIKIQSGFGNIVLGDFNKISFFEQSNLDHYDNELGFSISKPNESWDFNTNLDEIKNNADSSMGNFLGGIFVEQNNDQRIFVGVFNVENLIDFSLINYIEFQTEFMQENHNAIIDPLQFSSDKTWGIFGMTVESNGSSLYGEQILEIKNNKLYMIQYTGKPPSLLDDSYRKDVLSIMDSFGIL